jgi:CDI toxin RNase A-like protein
LGQRDAKLFSRRQQNGALDEIFEFAHIAGPGIVRQRLHYVRGNVCHSLVLATAEFLYEITDQQRHVFGAFAQCGNMNRENIDSIVEVAAEFAFGDQGGEVVVGGGDQAYIDTQSAIPTKALELLFLQHAKKFGLELWWEVADFVEEKSAAVGKLEPPDFLRERAGEGATFVAEQLGFQQAGGDGGTIDFDEGAVATGAEVMDGAGDQFLAGASLAGDENGGSSGGSEFDLRKGAAEERTVADDFLEIKLGANFFLEIEFFDGEFILESVDFAERQCIFECDSDLTRHLLNQFHVGSGKRLWIAAGEINGPKRSRMGSQRDAADDLHVLIAKELADLGLKPVNLWASRDQNLAGRNGLACRGALERRSEFRLGCRGRERHIEGVDFQQRARLIQQREAGVVMLNHGFERRDDTFEESGDVAGADQEIVDFEKHTKAVALAGELALVGLGVFEINGVVDGHGNLGGNALHEFDFRVADALWDEAAKTQGPETMLRGGQGNNSDGAHALVLEHLHEAGVARIRCGIEGDERALIFPHPAGGRLADGIFRGLLDRMDFAHFEDVQAHGVARGVVQHENEKVEGQNGVETLSQFVKQGFQVALLGDGLADVEQRFELAPGMPDGRESLRALRRIYRVSHEFENSTAFGGVTIRAERAGVRGFAYTQAVFNKEVRLKTKFRLSMATRSPWLIGLLTIGLIALAGCNRTSGPEPVRQEQAARSAGASGAGERYDLERDEELGGHTLRKHVGRSDAELEERLRRERNISAASTWTDRETAEQTVGEALQAEHGRIESWMRRGYPRANLALHYDAGRVIGRSLRRGESQVVNCSSAVMVLRADGPESFFVLTTYPEERE